MVCSSCRAAAALARETEVIQQYLDGRPQEMLTGAAAARNMHMACPGGTWCDCQHKIGGRYTECGAPHGQDSPSQSGASAS